MLALARLWGPGQVPDPRTQVRRASAGRGLEPVERVWRLTHMSTVSPKGPVTCWLGRGPTAAISRRNDGAGRRSALPPLAGRDMTASMLKALPIVAALLSAQPALASSSD